jgi:hypothetical protein
MWKKNSGWPMFDYAARLVGYRELQKRSGAELHGNYMTSLDRP